MIQAININRCEDGTEKSKARKIRRRIAILTYAFPPQNRISALRPYKMAAEFYKNGWDVTVLCSSYTGASEDWHVDFSWADVYRYNPSKLSRALAQPDTVSNTYTERLISNFRKVARRLWLPEHTWLLKPVIMRELFELMSKVQFDCLVTISYPFVMHSIGRAAKQKWPHIVWVADNRDIWHGNPYRGFNLMPARIERHIEQQSLTRADIVSFAAYSPCDLYRSRYKLRHVVPILNGYEQDLHNDVALDILSKPELHVVHTGSLYEGKRDISPLLDALEKVSIELGIKVVLDLYGEGSTRFNRRKTPQNGHVTINAHGKIDREQTYNVQRHADLLAVVMAPTMFDRTYIPGKTFEYAATRIPVIALCHKDSDLSRLIRENQLGIGTFDAEEIADFICEYVSCSAVERFERKAPEALSATVQFGSLVRLVEAICGAPSHTNDHKEF